MPSHIRAFCHEGKWHDIEVEDDVTAYLEYPNGATGVFVTTTADAPGTNRLEVSGTRGRLVCENDSLHFDRLEVDEREWCATAKEGFARPPMHSLEVKTDGSNPQHTGVLNAFAANILRGEPLVADGREGIRGLMLSNAMHLSSWLNERWPCRWMSTASLRAGQAPRHLPPEGRRGHRAGHLLQLRRGQIVCAFSRRVKSAFFPDWSGAVHG